MQSTTSSSPSPLPRALSMEERISQTTHDMLTHFLATERNILQQSVIDFVQGILHRVPLAKSRANFLTAHADIERKSKACDSSDSEATATAADKAATSTDPTLQLATLSWLVACLDSNYDGFEFELVPGVPPMTVRTFLSPIFYVYTVASFIAGNLHAISAQTGKTSSVVVRMIQYETGQRAFITSSGSTYLICGAAAQSF